MEKEILGNEDDLIRYSDQQDMTIIPTKDEGIFRFITTAESKIPSYVFPMIPLYVTSYARTEMYKHFKKVGFKRVLYSDTDCIFTTRKISTSNELGELKHENTFDELIIVKPKFYAGLTEDEKNIVKIKGLHSMIRNFSALKNRIIANDLLFNTQHFRKLRSAIGQSDKYVNQIYQMDKLIDLEDDKRIWSKSKFDLTPQSSKPINL